MGTPYKLKPEIEGFILEQKKINPALSCRNLSALIKERFQVELSKSLVNELIKQMGLSSPVGRRRKTPLAEGKPVEIEEKPTVEIPQVTVEQIPPIETPEQPVEERPPVEAPQTPLPAEEATLLEQKEHIEPPLLEEVEKEGLIEIPLETPVPEVPIEKVAEPQITEIPVEEPKETAPVETPIETPVEAPIPEPAVSEQPSRPLELMYKPLETPVEEAGVPAEVGAEAPVSEQPSEPPKESLVEPHFEDSPDIPDLGEGVGGGAIFLKAIDSLVGGSYFLTRLVKEQQNREEPDLISRTEGLIYSPLFKPPVTSDSGFWTLVNSKCDFQLIISYLDDLQHNKTLDIEANRTIPKLFQEVLFLDIFLESGEVYHLDAELRSIWSAPNIPYDFALPAYKAKTLITRHFIRNKALVFFSAPGYDIPTKEFCDFITQWDSEEKKISRISLISNKADVIETIIPPPAGKRYVVFGLWPWQFTRHRRVINIGEFKPFYFEPLDQHFYITESEVTLVQPYTNQSLVFRTCLLKRDPTSKTTLMIGTNIDEDKASTEEIATLYLRHWPNLDEGFEDYSRKIELFTYTATSRRMFSIESAIQETGKELEVKEILNYYLRGLDSYLRWHILPAGYEDYDFPTANQRFYSLKAVVYKKNKYYIVQFYIPKNYGFEADLAYMCRRLNEKDITLRSGKVWFTFIKETAH